ncbi:unnamed protein product [Caenorhabditis auriculariae]|uniref:Flavin-containing monooxygenase n=1 Tax=Caenorhabditis auriculariae TaxID=2777116 RepID=A0A8S1GY37_9PELO|nr:unnamed protein product [Caenorhabditis auriculariae]
MRKKLLIVGAGASGLPSIRHSLFYENIDVTCMEGSDEIGGLWNYKPYDTELSSVMKSTVINTSKEMTAYSDFPPDPSMANFMHNTEMFRYLKNYAEKYELRQKIKFNHKVLTICRHEDYRATGRWKVEYMDEKKTRHSEVFDGVLLCSGHHCLPHLPPAYFGQEKFRGRVIHSHSYKDHRGYEDKVVVVVGIGNSGGDVAVELSRIAKQVYLVTRRGAWVFNRIFDYGEPVDLALSRKYLLDLQKFAPESISNWTIERKLNYRFDHERYGVRPKHRVLSAHPTVNDELPNRIACGTIRIKPNIVKFTENGIVFEDGTKVEQVDEVVMSTGFSFEFSVIENGKLIPVAENEVELYKYMFPLETSDHNSLGVIGLVQPYGSIMPLSEMQARVFLETFAGGAKLPPVTEMREDVNQKKKEMKLRYVASRRHTIQVDYVPYIEELAEIVGCQVDTFKLLFKDPVLAAQTYFGPRVPYIYRINGPNAWKGARRAIMDVEYRARMATGAKLVVSNPATNILYTVSSFLVILAIFYFLLF